MKYSKSERLLIGREIYTHALTIPKAAEKYQINPYTARDYMREYRDINNLPPMDDGSEEFKIIAQRKTDKHRDLADMDRNELIDEVIKARIEAERAKKGYIVKGGGRGKEFVSLQEANTK